MTTNLDIITDAYRDANIIPYTATPSAEQQKTGLRRLNQMMDLWDQGSLRLDWHAQVDVDDTIPVPTWSELAIIKGLAVSLLAGLGMPAPPTLSGEARDTFSAALTYSIRDQMEPADMSHLPSGSGGRYRYNINTDQ